MKILVFSWRDPKHSLAGGAEQVMHEHMRGWVEAGHEVTLFSSKIKDSSVLRETIDGVKILRRGIQLLGVQIAGFFYYLGNLKQFDLVVDQFHGIPFFTPLYVGKPKLAVIQEIAGKVWLINDLPKPFNWIVGVIGFLGEPIVFLLYRRIPFMTGSQSTKDDLIKLGIPKRNIYVVPHGTKITRPQPFPKKEKKKTVMFLGAISLDKGIDQVMETFGILNQKDDYQFWIVGRASFVYEKYIRDKNKELGLEKNLKFFGYVSEAKKFNLLARAHIVVNPSVLEGWGLVNIEANAMGTPVVAYNSPGLIDSVQNGKTGIICRENSPQAMVKEVMSLIDNKNKYERVRRRAVKWAESFSWQKSKKKSLALIDKVFVGRV